MNKFVLVATVPKFRCHFVTWCSLATLIPLKAKVGTKTLFNSAHHNHCKESVARK